MGQVCNLQSPLENKIQGSFCKNRETFQVTGGKILDKAQGSSNLGSCTIIRVKLKVNNTHSSIFQS